MQEYFNDLTDFIGTRLRGQELYTAAFGAEESDFVRFNGNEVRQAGHVTQRQLGLELIEGQRHAQSTLTLSGDAEADKQQIDRLLDILRATLPGLPEDPYLLYATEVRSSERHGEDHLPPAPEAVSRIMKAAKGTDLVGLFAAGGIYNGFANSLGQRNWFSTYSFNADWSLYHATDKAVKEAYAGFAWDDEAFRAKMTGARDQLKVLRRTPRTIDPGGYRVYLSPVAVYDILGTLAWGGFGLKDHRTKQTSLLRMVEGGARLHPAVTISENTAEGVAPNFQSAGFIRPGRVELIGGGCFRNCLTSPRSAKEYGVPTNGASTWEMPQSIDMEPGGLPPDEVTRALDR
ncbi:MAG: metallopeptidase TldD-related protein, partial [Candidatus Eiseniibacteriota bacterium]